MRRPSLGGRKPGDDLRSRDTPLGCRRAIAPGVRSMTRFFYWDRIHRHLLPRQNEMPLIVDGPLDHFAFRKIQRLRQWRRKVDIELRAFLALDALHFGWVAHDVF